MRSTSAQAAKSANVPARQAFLLRRGTVFVSSCCVDCKVSCSFIEIPFCLHGDAALALEGELARGLLVNAGDGNSILTTSLILAMMILPTIIGTTESAMRAVPAHYYEGALALGATKERSIFRVIIPAAKSGVIAGIVLGIGRAVGETMAVIMVAGNQPRMPEGIFRGVRTLTANIVIEMGYASGLHREALIATAVVLFVLILIINLCCSALQRGNRQ